MEYVQLNDCSRWMFDGIPEFGGGVMSPLFADCGEGLPHDGKSSFMHMFTGTSANDAADYAALLSESFEKVFENKIGGNLYYQFAVPEGLLYVSFMKNSGITRVILDRCRCEQVRNFGYSEFTAVNKETVLAQYSLYYNAMISGITSDCGMNYVYRLADNSLIIIDGGEFEQSTDEAVEDYMTFLRELTGTAAGEKMRVSLWLCTHAHNDHCDFMSKLIRFHFDEFTVERAAFNFPCEENVGHSKSVIIARERLLAAYPEVSFVKLHAGMKFSIADAEVEILVSNEDTIGLDEDDPFTGMNATSTVFKITVSGHKALFLADCGNENGDCLVENYSMDEVTCDILQAAHHGINEILRVYEHISAGAVMLPQCRMNMKTRFPRIFANLGRLYGEDNVYLANDATYIFAMKDEVPVSSRPQVGGAYDGSEW